MVIDLPEAVSARKYLSFHGGDADKVFYIVSGAADTRQKQI